MIFLISVWTKAIVAAKNAVVIPTIVIILSVKGEYSKIGEHLTTKKTPAVTIVATMVTAGVFLVVRCSPIFEYSPLTLNIITIVGMTTAFFAATIALVQTDIKKIIAYSTCSQLGYMFFAAGVGAYNVAMFHLFTHEWKGETLQHYMHPHQQQKTYSLIDYT